MVTISNKEKWARVDAIIERIEERKKNGDYTFESPLEQYVDFHFNPKSRTKKG